MELCISWNISQPLGSVGQVPNCWSVHIPLWVCCTVWVMTPCTIRTLQVQTQNTSALPWREERKGFIRTVWILTRISNVVLYSVQSHQVHTALCCKTGRGVFCDAVTQRWRCMIAQCGKESSHIRMCYPLSYWESQATHQLFKANLSYIFLLDEFLPAPGLNHQAFNQSWHFKRVSSA